MLKFSCSLYAYYKVCTSRIQDADPTVGEYPSYNQLRYAWYSYLKLLDINYSEGSICPECGPTPNIIVCDATTVAFCRKMVLHGISEDSNNDRFENISCGI